jgi:hypothetical protein
MDLRQQTTNTVADLRDLAGQIFIKAAQHRELCDLAVGQLQRAKRVRQATGSLSDDVSVAGVGFGFTGMQVGNAPHRKPRQIGHQHTLVARYRDRERADCGRLIYNQQNRTVLFELADQCSQFRFVVGQGAVQKTFSLAIQCNAMMRSLAYVETDEDLDAVMLLNIGHAISGRFTTVGQQTMATDLGIHVTGDLGRNRVQPLSAIISCPPSPVTTPPGSWATGGSSHAGLGWPTPDYLGSRTR